MAQFADFTDAERETVIAIAERAVALTIHTDAVNCMMDISATHVHCPLRLDDLLAADDFNFAHDITGINRHLNHETGQLTNHFLPRFAR